MANFIGTISGIRDKSTNNFLFRMTGITGLDGEDHPFGYYSGNGIDFIRVSSSGELLNQQIPKINLNIPFHIVFVHKWGQLLNNTPYIPFSLDCTGISGVSKLAAVYTPFNNGSGTNVFLGMYTSENKLIGPSFSVSSYGSLTGTQNFIVDQWIYSGSNYFGKQGSTFK
jgi:hypothetical protein